MNALAVLAVLLATAGAPGFDEFFERFAASRDETRSLAASFTQTNISRRDHFTTEGTMLYVRPRRLLFRYDDPGLAYLVNGDTAYEHDPEVEQLDIHGLEALPELDAFFLAFEADPERIREAFAVSVIEPEDDYEDAVGLELTPIVDPELPPPFVQARVYFRGEDMLPYRMRIVNDDQSTIIIHATNFRKNVADADEQARLTVPEGTTVVRQGRFAGVVGPGGATYPLREAAPSDSPVHTEELEE